MKIYLKMISRYSSRDKLNYVVTEVYKVKNNISPEIMRDLRKWKLQLEECYPSCFQKNENNINFEKDGILGAKIWSLLPEERKKCFIVCKFLKINWRNWNQQTVNVGFVRHIFNTLALPKLASWENSFWNAMRE